MSTLVFYSSKVIWDYPYEISKFLNEALFSSFIEFRSEKVGHWFATFYDESLFEEICYSFWVIAEEFCDCLMVLSVNIYGCWFLDFITYTQGLLSSSLSRDSVLMLGLPVGNKSLSSWSSYWMLKFLNFYLSYLERGDSILWSV